MKAVTQILMCMAVVMLAAPAFGYSSFATELVDYSSSLRGHSCIMILTRCLANPRPTSKTPDSTRQPVGSSSSSQLGMWG